MGDCFTPQGLIVLGALATTLSAAFGVLYRDGLRSRDAQIHDLIDQRDRLLARALASKNVAQEAASAVRRAAGGGRR